MSPQFHIDLGPFSFSLEADSSGIGMRRGPMQKTFAWGVITALSWSTQKKKIYEQSRPLLRLGSIAWLHPR